MGREGCLPSWMAEVGEAVGYLDPPHWSKFKATDEPTGVTLRGEADAMFTLADGACAIVDYKTSRYNPENRGQLRVYRAQLNAYAWISRRLGFPQVSRVALIYMEPASDSETADIPEMVDESGFVLGFRPRVVEVELDPERLIPPLLRQAARTHAMPEPPPPREGCKDCAALDALRDALAE